MQTGKRGRERIGDRRKEKEWVIGDGEGKNVSWERMEEEDCQ